MALRNTGIFRTLAIAGNDGTSQNLVAIQNLISSRVDIKISKLVVQLDSTASLNSLMPLVRLARATNIPEVTNSCKIKEET